MTTINAFVEPEGVSESAFREAFLSSPEFRKRELALIADAPPSRASASLLHDVLALTKHPDALDRRAIGVLAERERPWLAFHTGQVSSYPQLGDPVALMRGTPAPGWYGPIWDAGSKKAWYLRYKRIEHWVSDPNQNGTASPARVKVHARWFIVAEVTQTYTAFSWQNFTTGRHDDDIHDAMPYWQHLPGAVEELRKILGATWNEPQMYDLVLDAMWERYINDTGWTWEHYRIRAEEDRVVVNARSVRSGGDGVDEMKGLEKLADRLGRTAIQQVGLAGSRLAVAGMRNALLHTLIKDWSPKSYEFFLADVGAAKSNDLHVHCFFGARPSEQTKDRFQHFHCMSTSGGHKQALRRLLEELDK